MNISEIMSAEIKCCCEDETLDNIAMMMWEGNCGSIPVVDVNSRPVGMVTDRDIAMSCALNHKAPWELQASTITGNRNLYTCTMYDPLETAIATMQNNKIRRLAIVDEEGYLTGMLSIDDIIAHSGKGKTKNVVPYETTMNALKAVTIHH